MAFTETTITGEELHKLLLGEAVEFTQPSQAVRVSKRDLEEIMQLNIGQHRERTLRRLFQCLEDIAATYDEAQTLADVATRDLERIDIATLHRIADIICPNQ